MINWYKYLDIRKKILISIIGFLLLGILNHHITKSFMTIYSMVYSYLIFLLLIILLTINFKRIISKFKEVHNKTWFLLIILLLSFMFLDLQLPNFYGMTIDEPSIIHIASNIASNESNIFCEPGFEKNQCGLSFLPFGWTFINSLVFKIFGISAKTSKIIILLFHLLAIIACFLFLQYVSRKEWISLLGTLIFASSSLFLYWSQTLNSIIPATGFLLTTLLFLLMFLREKKLWQNNLLLISLTWTVYIRTEMAILIIPIGIVYLSNIEFFKDKKNFFSTILLLIIFSSFLNFIPHFIETQKAFLSGTEQIFGMNILLSNIFLESSHWIQGAYLPLSFLTLAMIGVIFSLKKERFETIIIISTILSILFVYLFWHYSNQRRFFITILPIITLYIALGAQYTSLILRKFMGKKALILIVLIILIIGILGLVNEVKKIDSIEEDYYDSEKIEELMPDNCSLIMAEPVMLPFIDNKKKISFNSITNSNTSCFISINCVFFYYDNHCRERDNCREFIDRPDVEKKEIIDDLLYRII